MDMTNLLRDQMRIKPRGTFDCAPKAPESDKDPEQVRTFDEARAGDYAASDLATRAAATINQWVETDDLDESEGLADRLMMMFVGIADENKDGELTDEESDVVSIALGAGYDYLTGHGVKAEDASALLNDWDEDAAERIRDLLAEDLSDGDGDIDNFAFSPEDQEPALDSCMNETLDAVYRKTFAVRGGKKVRINKRISGTVRLSAKQKVAIRKARMKSHSAAAMMKRMKSMRIRTRMGLGKK